MDTPISKEFNEWLNEQDQVRKALEARKQLRRWVRIAIPMVLFLVAGIGWIAFEVLW